MEIDAGGGVVMPGLVDPHTHFAPQTGLDAGHDSPQPGRRIDDRLQHALMRGVTTVEVKCADLETLSELSTVARSSDVRLPEIVATLFGAAPPPEMSTTERMAELISDAIPTVRRNATATGTSCIRPLYSPPMPPK